MTGLATIINIQAPEGTTWEFTALFLIILTGPILLEKMRLPGLVGLLLGGYLIGAHGLGVIPAGNTTMPDLGQLGLLYLMFIAGVELDLSVLSTHRAKVLVFASIAFTIPMVAGTAVGLLLGWSILASLLLGSLLSSHTLLTYPIIRQAGLSGTPAAATAVGATVVTDTVALIVLAIVVGIQGGSGSGAEIGIQLLIGLALLLAVTLWLMPRLARLALRRFGTERPIRYLIVITAFLVAATLSEMLSVEGIVGAFFAGLALNRLVPNGGPLMNRVEFFGSAFFVPVFMVSVGLLLDPSVMVEPATLGLALLMMAICLGGRAIASGLTVPLLGFNRNEAWLIFSMTTPQAAATLAAVMVGFKIGLFGEVVVNASLVVILVSVIISTLAAESAASRLDPPDDSERSPGSNLLVAMEDPAQVAAILKVARWITQPEGGAVTVISVGHPDHPDDDKAARDLLRRSAIEAGLDPRVLTVRSATFARGVMGAAASMDASLVLAGLRPEPARAAGGWVEALAGFTRVPVAMVSGGLEDLGTVRSLGGSGASAESDLIGWIGDRLALAVEDEDGERGGTVPAAGLMPAPGELLVRPVYSWELLAGLPPAPDDAGLILVPERPEGSPPVPVADDSVAGMPAAAVRPVRGNPDGSLP